MWMEIRFFLIFIFVRLDSRSIFLPRSVPQPPKKKSIDDEGMKSNEWNLYKEKSQAIMKLTSGLECVRSSRREQQLLFMGRNRLTFVIKKILSFDFLLNVSVAQINLRQTLVCCN